jgi:pyruvate/2-oxoglutarate dehydrogenase complex dihydrolipoamide dehydrogenase (E3) component
MAPEELEVDVVVVGAGPVGENVADRVIAGGLSTAIVEAELVGGECSFWACIPSKALLRSGQALRAAGALSGAREAVTGALDARALLAHRDHAVADYDDATQVPWLDSIDARLVRGHARLAGERTVEVFAGNRLGVGRHDGLTGAEPQRADGGRTEVGSHGGAGAADQPHTRIRARRAVVVATGSSPALPPIPGLDTARVWTAREATGAVAAPTRLLVLGGGVVGVEMATAFADMGSAVTVLARGDRLLDGVEPHASELVAKALSERGVDIRLSTQVTAVARAGATVTVTTDGGEQLVAEELLVAVGRTPASADLGLATVGIGDGSWLTVDESGLVQGPDGTPVAGGWLYAVGDITHRVLLTHQGKYAARAVGDVIAARARGLAEDDPGLAPWGRYVPTADHAAVPQVVFSSPEVAAVGLTEAAARTAGLPVAAVQYDLGSVSGAHLAAEDYAGWAKLVYDTERRVVLGVTLVGPDVAEMIHAATVMVVGEVPLSRLWHAVPSFPTVSEIWLRLLEAIGRE